MDGSHQTTRLPHRFSSISRLPRLNLITICFLINKISVEYFTLNLMVTGISNASCVADYVTHV
uniref:Uncharacterized protein n=1 Tax=Anguilla anguilla TaxID=7936 RepID=A0A0E9X922_ANGAN